MSFDRRRRPTSRTRDRRVDKRDGKVAAKIDLDELIAVARIVRVRGIKGETVASLLTDFPERFEGIEELIALREDVGGNAKAGEPFMLQVENFWFQKDRVILKFAGYDSIEAATELIGCTLHVHESESVELEADEYYDWQLEDCAVETIDNVSLGTVREVLHTGGVPVLVIKSDESATKAADGDGEATKEGATETVGGSREHLVPLAKTICVEVDVERKLIRVDPPDGLLEI